MWLRTQRELLDILTTVYVAIQNVDGGFFQPIGRVRGITNIGSSSSAVRETSSSLGDSLCQSNMRQKPSLKSAFRMYTGPKAGYVYTIYRRRWSKPWPYCMVAGCDWGMLALILLKP